MRLNTITRLLSFLVTVEIAYGGLVCKDEDDNPVDWFVLYKLPRIKRSSNHLIQSGVAYAYITSHTVPAGWVLSTLSINDSKSLPGHTLQPLYNMSSILQDRSTLWFVYNDQPPSQPVTIDLGHTKGVVTSQVDGGFWMVHSVPHFPPKPENMTATPPVYSYPHTATRYGQSFLCISLAASQMDLVGIQLTYNEPKIYGSCIPEDLKSTLPHLVAAANNTRVRTAPWYHQQILTSFAGQTFYSFAKAKKFNKELYFDWVAPTLQTNLLVESWRNGAGELPSSCNNTYIVENISSLKFKAASIQFNTTHDHSKWAVADKENIHVTKDWVCVGDINRMEEQEKRGGGTICINHPKLWPAYRQIINGFQPCPHD